MIAYTDNAQVIIELKKLIMDNRITHREVAERIGMSPQAFNKLLHKKNFSFEDAQRILNAIGYNLVFDCIKAEQRKDTDDEVRA